MKDWSPILKIGFEKCLIEVMKRFVVGDIHGGYKALAQCLKRSEFDPEKDFLISLGDICDGWPEVDKTNVRGSNLSMAATGKS